MLLLCFLCGRYFLLVFKKKKYRKYIAVTVLVIDILLQEEAKNSMR